jgi:hypothetical protein
VLNVISFILDKEIIHDGQIQEMEQEDISTSENGTITSLNFTNDETPKNYQSSHSPF